MWDEIKWNELPPRVELKSPEDVTQCVEYPKIMSSSERSLYYGHHIMMNVDSDFPMELVDLITSFIDTLYCVGDHLECMDSLMKWRTATVIDKQGFRVCVHYDGWSKNYDSWIEQDSERLMSMGTHSNGFMTIPWVL